MIKFAQAPPVDANQTGGSPDGVGVPIIMKLGASLEAPVWTTIIQV
ncbi:hypothetical protein [Obesumbacterium proteus]|nr:hypothetical protein [Obesumbacterium proteus]